MGYLTISNFRFGLDTRRSVLTSLAGTLLTLNNAHVNQGGEIEKRKAFVRTVLPAACFGLEATDVGLITFGSDADPGGWPIGNVAAYQRLQHPAILATTAAVYNAAFHAMTQIVFSRAFRGKAFVGAKFADGRTFLYYDGQLVEDSADGLVLPGYATQTLLNAAIAQQMVDEFLELEGWYAQYGDATFSFYIPTGIGTDTDVYFQVKSPDTVTFTIDPTLVTTNGLLGYLNFGSAAATPGLASKATFSVLGGVGDTYVLVAPWQDDSPILVGLTNPSVPVPFNTDLNQTAADIVTAVNARTSIHGYTAAAVGAVVTVSAPIPVGTFPTTYNQGSLSIIYDPAAGAPVTTPVAFLNGTFATVAWGQREFFMVKGAWAVGDTWSLDITTNAGDTYVLGKGNLTGSSPTTMHVGEDRVFVSIGDQFNFSAVGEPTLWEDQNTGAGFVRYTSNYGAADTVNGFSDYQGRLAVYGRRSIQIWTPDADPASFVRNQVLENIGTMAPFSIQAIGELDALFLSDTGIRSLRVRDSSLNAFVADLGSPIDALVQTALELVSDTTKAAACAVVEPTENRYWLFLNNTIYVLSYYPSNKIIAWSTYNPTYGAGQDSFAPQKFAVFDGQVYARDASAVYSYGGSSGVEYDTCVAIVQTPFLSGAKDDSPATVKTAKGIDVAMSGEWILSAGMDWVSQTLEEVYDASQASFDGGTIPFDSKGTHFSLKAVTSQAARARLSSLIFHFNEGEETA